MRYVYLILVSTLLLSCSSNSDNKTKQVNDWPQVEHPEWSKNKSIYEVNIRQYTPEGTFRAFEEHLPRLKELGTEILWLMPIHPIGEKNRKGELGSYYSIKDFQKVNPNFGTMEDFKHLVDKAHSMDMYVIIDWVANHTAWDNWMLEEHPEWYMRNPDGELIPPRGTDWSDVVQLDYRNDSLREYMIESMKFWVEEADIDGYRCDYAGPVPTDFWNDARETLDKIKPVWMLAEWEDRELHNHAFDATYGWSIYDIMHDIWRGRKTAAELSYRFSEYINSYPRDEYHMFFTSNHDKNTWDGNMYEQFGDALHASIVVTATAPGIPLVYNGQEAGNRKQLEFFQKATIQWKQDSIFHFFSSLLNLKKEHEALWNGKAGGEMWHVRHDQLENVFAFVRRKTSDQQILVVTNFSSEARKVKLGSTFAFGGYTEHFSDEKVTVDGNSPIELEPWGYKIFVR